ncbi:putative F-box protein At1g61060 [Capsella rubella]|uniref:putative F-box protein At1g61060 n=1 Tax=Capsella rubella TaxID=81985 RepID=UPI000CD5BAA5|nr:putative F-box protein At1g61060 [Capsella rubella]
MATEENLTLTVPRSSNQRCEGDYFSQIPVDLLFPFESPDPPRLLFTFVSGENLYFYSAPQPPQTVLDNNSYVTATLHNTYSRRRTVVSHTCRPVRGLVCHQREEENHIVVVVSNPITGESVTSPRLKTDGIEAKTYFGYDPTGNKFKIPCCISYSPLNDGVCINGVLYYAGNYMIVCFNVRSEKFDFINETPEKLRFMWRTLTLISYKGKLGLLADTRRDDDDRFVFWLDDDRFVFWVLEDAEEHKWSKHTLVTPFQLSVLAVGVTDRGEIVLSPKYAEGGPFYISYYNLESNTVVRVRLVIPGLELLKGRCRVYTFPNYVEDVKLIM